MFKEEAAGQGDVAPLFSERERLESAKRLTSS